MYRLRSVNATNGEIKHHTIIQRIILFGAQPVTLLERLAAAVVGNRYIDVIAQAKILKNLDLLLDEAQNAVPQVLDAMSRAQCIDILQNPKIVDVIRNKLNTIKLEIGDPIHLPKRPPIMSMQPKRFTPHKFEMTLMPSTLANISEFESLVFNNRCRYRYLDSTTFATYLMQNLLYSLNAETVEQLELNRVWQAQLAVLLHQTNYNEYVAQTAFYEDSVRFRGIVYDTSFVPKYDVKALVPQGRIRVPFDFNSLIDYYNKLDVKINSQIDLKYLRIFFTFPFKDGHYIQPSGKIVLLDLKGYQCRQSTRLIINRLCNSNDLEYAVASAAQNLSIDDVIQYTVMTTDIQQQALGLLVLRCMIGGYLTIDRYTIRLPSALNILSWTKFTCSENQKAHQIVLPHHYPVNASKLDRLLSLIRDIANSCCSAQNCVLLCSSYSIPEYCLTACYKSLQNDAEKYVFFTLLLQVYKHATYVMARNYLKPQFGCETSINVNKQHPITSPRLYVDATLGERIEALTEPLIRPTDFNANLSTTCPPYKCIDLYEFTNEQLRELVSLGRTQLTPQQKANLIALTLIV